METKNKNLNYDKFEKAKDKIKYIRLRLDTHNIDWNYIVEYYQLTYDFMLEYLENLDIDYIIDYQNMQDVDFLVNLYNRINNNVEKYKGVTNFFEKLEEAVDWEDISKSSDYELTSEFLNIYESYLHWEILLSNWKHEKLFTFELFKKYKNVVQWVDVFIHKKFNLEQLEEIMSFIEDKYTIDVMVETQDLTEEFIIKHIDKFNLDTIGQELNLSLNFLKTHKKNIDIYSIIKNKTFRDNINTCLEDFKDLIDERNAWSNISEIPLSLDTIIKFSDKFQNCLFSLIGINGEKLTEDVIENYFDFEKKTILV